MLHVSTVLTAYFIKRMCDLAQRLHLTPGGLTPPSQERDAQNVTRRSTVNDAGSGSRWVPMPSPSVGVAIASRIGLEDVKTPEDKARIREGGFFNQS